MKWLRLLTLIAVAICSACTSTDLWTAKRDVVPVTYEIGKDPVKRSVGRLRRLVVLPIALEDRNPDGLSEQFYPDDWVTQTKAMLLVATSGFLVERLGYEVTALDRLNKSSFTESTNRAIAVLTSWSATAPDGASSPPDVKAAVAALGAAFRADGVLVIQGYIKKASAEAFMAVFLTAGMAWPLLYADHQKELHADIYEVASGQMVWRHKQEGDFADEGLLTPLEPALPAIFERSRQ